MGDGGLVKSYLLLFSAKVVAAAASIAALAQAGVAPVAGLPESHLLCPPNILLGIGLCLL